MTASKVYFYDKIDSLKIGVNKFFKMIGEECKTNEKVGIKLHFGEGENDTYVDPKLLQDVTKFIKNPVFIECNVLYRGNRTKKEDHIKQAKAHGFGFLEIDILDGQQVEDYLEIEINEKNTKRNHQRHFN